METLFNLDPVPDPRMVPVKAHLRRVTTDTSPIPRHRLSDPQTSAQAAKSVAGQGIESKILAVFVGQPYGLTDDELCGLLPSLYAPTIKSARSRLSKNGYLTDSGSVRPSQRGRDMTVWFLATR